MYRLLPALGLGKATIAALGGGTLLKRRAYVRVVASVLCAGLLLVTLSPVAVQADELRLDPTHGQATDPFDAVFVFTTEFRQKGCGFAPGTTVLFIWWGTDGESSAELGL